ncbi:MAG TPA: DUF2232 domain-containing protein [Gemmatimonadales bacterium]
MLAAAFLIGAIQLSPVFFLGLLGVLLLISRPTTGREWFWIALCALIVWWWTMIPETLPQRTIQASAAAYIGCFVLLTLARIRSLFIRATLSVIVSALVVATWYLLYHLQFSQFINTLVTESWNGFRTLQPGWHLPPTPVYPVDDGATLSTTATADIGPILASALTRLVPLYPAAIALTALLGTWLAWGWYQRIALHPLADAAPPFSQFRFNDHLIWVLVVVATVVLFVTNPGIKLVGENALVVVVALYIARGGAVSSATLRQMPPLLVALMALMILLVFYLVLIGLAAIGVADTWIDFRRRRPPLTGAPR